MCTACDPEPVDEQPPAVAETRGGNQLADITVGTHQMPEYDAGGTFPDLHLPGTCTCCTFPEEDE